MQSTAKTTKKKVKIQTPPHSPEEPRRRLSSSEKISPPPAALLQQQNSLDESDDSGSTATADEELEEAWRNTRRNSGSLSASASGATPSALPTSTIKAPYNPFARTLATTEAAYGLKQEDEAGDKDEDSDDPKTSNKPLYKATCRGNYTEFGTGEMTVPKMGHQALRGDTFKELRQSVLGLALLCDEGARQVVYVAPGGRVGIWVRVSWCCVASVRFLRTWGADFFFFRFGRKRF